jgi:hypothetical protein
VSLRCSSAVLTHFGCTCLFQQAYLGETEAVCVRLPSPSIQDLHLDGASWTLQAVSACHWLLTFHAYRALLIGAAFVCKQTRRVLFSAKSGPLPACRPSTSTRPTADPFRADLGAHASSCQIRGSTEAKRLAESELFIFPLPDEPHAMAHHSRWSSTMSLPSPRALPCAPVVVLIAISHRHVGWH